MDRLGRAWNRISTKLVASLLVIAAVGLSLSVYSVEAGRAALEEAVGSESMEMSRHFALAVDRGIYSKMHEMMIISLGVNMRSWLSASNAEFEAMSDPEAYIDLQEADWTSVPMNQTSPLMDEILANDLSLDLRNRLDVHYIREHGIDVYGEVQVSNRYGAVIAMTSRSADYRQDDEGWWQAAEEDGEYVGGLEEDDAGSMFGIPIGVRVTDSEGAFMGVMRAFVGATEVVMEAQFEARIFESTEVDILTPDMRLVYSTHAFVPYEDESTRPYVQRIEGESGYFISGEAGRERLYSYATSPGYIEYEGSDWIFLMSHDTEEVLASAIYLRSEIIFISILLFTAFLAVALLLSTGVTVPVQSLKRATQRMSEGHLDERVAIKNRDELGDLAQAFNAMAADLEGLYTELEGKVLERTKELGAANSKLKILGSITRHDALNQLSVMRGWLSVSDETCTDMEAKKYFGKIRQSLDVLEAQLNFTAMYEKIGVHAPEWVDARLAVETSIPGLDLGEAKVVNRLQGLEVLADQMFPRVLRNLAENAVKHGERTTRVTFRYEERPEGIAIMVEDDGVGVPAELKTLIFERVKSARTGRAGFGLYLSRAILAMTDISIRETGEPGKGARFEMYVPKARARVRPPSGL
jgi:signal transduction histidine kinase